MLTSDLAIVEYRDGLAIPDRLTQQAHSHYRVYAERMLQLYRQGIGRTRRELHRDVENIFGSEPDCDIRRIRAFGKLLDDVSEYSADAAGIAADLRLKVFSLAAAYHPLVRTADRLFEHSEEETKDAISRELGRPWPEIDAALYADVPDCQRLLKFSGYEKPDDLLSRYNVAQAQACLYRAARAVVEARNDFKTIIRYLKLTRLLHDIQRLGPSRYRIVIAGPASVLMETRRYGVNFACFLPALLVCRDWRLWAEVPTPWGAKARFILSDEDGLRSHMAQPSGYDSSVEERFAVAFGANREGWELCREAEILHAGQRVFVPDFVLRHPERGSVFLEIVGFWTPEYLAHKRQVLRLFRNHPILLAVPAKSLRAEAEKDPTVIPYKTALKPADVLAALARISRGAAK